MPTDLANVAFLRRSRLVPQSTLHDRLRARLASARDKAGLSRRELSIRLGRQPTLVARVERGERTLELGEFVAIFALLGLDPARVLAELLGSEAGGENPE